MKFIYVIMLFLIFFNIFSVMVDVLGIMPNVHTPAGDIYESGMEGGQSLAEDLTENQWNAIVGIGKANADFVAICTAAIALGILMHSAAVVGVGLFVGLILSTIRLSQEAMEPLVSTFGIDNFLLISFTVGMAFLLIITLIEYFTHGDV